VSTVQHESAARQNCRRNEKPRPMRTGAKSDLHVRKAGGVLTALFRPNAQPLANKKPRPDRMVGAKVPHPHTVREIGGNLTAAYSGRIISGSQMGGRPRMAYLSAPFLITLNVAAILRRQDLAVPSARFCKLARLNLARHLANQ
jgi:hypothetical protein